MSKITQIELHRLKNNWAYAQKIWGTERTKHRLHGWLLKLETMHDKAGLCSYVDQTITISSIFMRGHNCNYAKVKKVLMHEIAHALTPGHSHGAGWKKKCREIGGDSRLAVTMVMPGMKWAMTCQRCKWRRESPTHPGNDHVCRACNTRVNVKYIK